MSNAKTWTLNSICAVATITADGCWLWSRRLHRTGYAYVSTQGRTVAVHRLAYELAYGPIPEGSVIDHTCHTRDLACSGGYTCPHRACCNPEAVEPYENFQRGRAYQVRTGKTHCPQGHPYKGRNLIRKYGRRYCRACIYARRNASRRQSA